MKPVEARLVGSEAVAEGTRAFHFTRPEDFRFKAGQAIDVLLDGGAGDDHRHTFSIASAPAEGRLTVATRMRDSAFKRALGALPAGAAVQLEGPSGSLTLHGDISRPAVFIAGGIGVTPFMSMLRQAAREHSARRLVLLYSNRHREDAAWLDELQAIAGDCAGFRLLPVMTATAGRLDAGKLSAATADLSQPVYYVTGTPALVAAMREALNAGGVKDDDIRSEDFYGY